MKLRICHKVARINTYHLEPHPGIYRLLMKRKLDVYEEKLIS